jgi:hypothetical protein
VSSLVWTRACRASPNTGSHFVWLTKYTMMCQSNTTKLYCVYYCTRAKCFDTYRPIFRPF